MIAPMKNHCLKDVAEEALRRVSGTIGHDVWAGDVMERCHSFAFKTFIGSATQVSPQVWLKAMACLDFDVWNQVGRHTVDRRLET